MPNNRTNAPCLMLMAERSSFRLQTEVLYVPDDETINKHSCNIRQRGNEDFLENTFRQYGYKYVHK